MDHSEAIVQNFDEILNKNECARLCRKYRFTQRSSSKLQGHEFIKVMILPSEGVTTDSLKGLSKRIREFNPEANLSSQALCERINNPSSGRLLKAVFAKIIYLVRSQMIRGCSQLSKALEGFSGVLIEDSTVCALNEKLAQKYEGTGRGGTGPKSQVKIDLIYDVTKGQMVDAEIYGGKDTDQGLAGRIINYLQPGNLVIRDLGYFVLRTLRAISEKGGYFLSRLLPNVKIYFQEHDEQPLDFVSYIKKHCLRQKVIELEVFLGEEKIPTRLVLYRAPEEIVNQRLRDANKRAKATGRVISKGKKLCLHFSIFVTNAPIELLPSGFIGTVYRLRWEIELVFKRWKSQLKIQHLKGINVNRIECLIWGRLCTVLMLGLITGYFSKIAREKFNVEISEAKLIDYLLRGSIVCVAVQQNRLADLMEETKKDLRRMLCKDRRNRRTMRERICLYESYYNVLKVNGSEAA